jgi:predicted dehydrogenase
MAAAAHDADAIALLNFEFRHHPGRIALRSLIQDGAIGTVEHVQWTVFGAGFRVPMRPYGWLFDAERGGGWIGAWGSHVIDFLRWTFGELGDESARLRTDITERTDADGNVHACTAEDGFTALMRTSGGVSVTIDTTFVAVKNSPPRVVVLGSDGTLESIADGRITLRNAEGTHEAFTFDAPREDPHLVPMRAWAEVVRDAVRNRTVPEGEPTFDDGVACARVMDALRRVRA